MTDGTHSSRCNYESPGFLGGVDAALGTAASERPLLAISLLLFIASTAVTTLGCRSMSAMGEMAMPGGWGLSMIWTRMPGQTWIDLAVSFAGMWIVMMVAMMLPCLVPMLSRYRRALGATSERRLGRLSVLASGGYFFVWGAFGLALFPLGVGLAAIEMHWPALARAVPLTAGMVVLIAGALQFSAWKARHLACCSERPRHSRVLSGAGGAWRHGVSLGLRCGCCCINLMAILLVIGVMDLRAMVLVTAALAAERWSSSGGRVARVMGVPVIALGLFLIARAAIVA